MKERFLLGFGSIASGEAVFDRYGMPIGFLRSWHVATSRCGSEVVDFSIGGHYDRQLLEPIITLELGQTCPQGKEVKVRMDMNLDLYEQDNIAADIPLSQFGRYAFGLDKLADGLVKAVDGSFMTAAEAQKEFRQFVVSIQKDEEKTKLIAALEERLAELQSGE